MSERFAKLFVKENGSTFTNINMELFESQWIKKQSNTSCNILQIFSA